MNSIAEQSRFAAAVLRLLLQVNCRPLRGIEVYIDDGDPKHVSIYVPHDDHWVVSGFDLDEPTTEAEFDPAPWVEAIEGN